MPGAVQNRTVSNNTLGVMIVRRFNKGSLRIDILIAPCGSLRCEFPGCHDKDVAIP